MKLFRLIFSSTLAIPIIMGSLVTTYSSDAEATAAFARATGSKCNKCHTLSFPRLTPRGERFMRNGFQLEKEADIGDFGLSDDEPSDKKDKLLKEISDILSITGDFEMLTYADGDKTPTIAVPNSVSVMATATITKDIPYWVGIDVSGASVEIHRYLIGRTNLFGSKLFNIRMGTIDPTTWTSFYGHSGALDSASSDVGAYGGGHHGGGANFSQIGPGYGQRNSIEYYGYTKHLFWSAGVGNGDSAAADDHTDDAAAHDHGTDNTGGGDSFDYWAVGRLDFGEGHSISGLFYKAFGASTANAGTLSANFRFKNLDIKTQFTMDTQRILDGEDPAYGLTFQADYQMHKKFMGVYRYDTTDNGESGGVESQMTIALVYKPIQNIKMSAAFVSELDAATSDSPFGNHGTINLHYMF